MRAVCFYKKENERNFKKLLSLKEEFKKYGLVFVDSEPDILFCDEISPRILEENKPIIILERWSSSTLLEQTKEALKEPYVVGVFKNRVMRNPFLYNEEVIRGRYHFSLINKIAQIGIPDKKEKVGKKYFKKIFCIAWDYRTSNYAGKILALKDQQIHFHESRPIDVFFAGSVFHAPTSNETNTWYTWHRKKAIEVIHGMKNIESRVYEGRPLAFDEYIDMLKKSKIVVSPWGLGEWCFKDAEAMLCGCVLIKPDTSFVLTSPDMYKNNETYLPCKADFSDLENQITLSLRNYDALEALRKKARSIFDGTTLDKLVFDFVGAVHEALREYGNKDTK